jgi:hypothetical protein
MKFSVDELCVRIMQTLNYASPRQFRVQVTTELVADVRAALKERDDKIEELELEMLAEGERDE